MKFLAVLFLTLLTAAAPAAADSAVLWYGEVKKGEVASRKNALGGMDIAVEQAVKELGLLRNANEQGVIVSMSGFTVEFWSGASVIRSAHGIVALTSPIVVEDGHWWVDSKSSAQAFDKFFTAIGIKPGVRFEAGGAPSKLAAKPVSTTKAEPNPKPKAKPEPKPEPKPEAKPEPKPEPKPEVKPEPKPETKLEAEPKPTPVKAVVPPAAFKPGQKPIVVLDAGHGGHDPGASANGLREKNINLKATMQLGKILASMGVDVRYTRQTDVYLKLAERTAIANKNNAAVFISMHCNAVPKGRKASGLEYYIMALPSDKDAMQLAITENREIANGEDSGAAVERSDKRTQLLLKILGDMQQNDKINESTQLCEVLHANAKASGLPMRKVGQAPFFVLRGAAMPAVLVEMGFLTDAAEAKQLNTESYRDRLCRSIAASVVKYIKDHPVNVE